MALAVLLFCALAGFVVSGLDAVRDNANSSVSDQRSYLGLGLKIRAGKKLTDGNRHPLYPALLAIFARREWAYFTGGKLLSLALGALSLLVIFWLTKRLRGAEVALSVLFLLSINPIFRRVTSHVMAESLLVGLFFVAWYLTGRGFSRQSRWIGAGAVAALAYLTKGTGQLLLMAFMLTVILRYGRGIRQAWRGTVGYVVAYSLVAAPLWAYNLAKYGNPLHSFSITHAMWFDTWEDKYAREQLPTLVSFLRSHGLGHVLARQWQGLSRVLPEWVEAIAPGRSGLWLLAFVMLLLSAALIWRQATGRYLRDHHAELLYSSLLVAIFYLLFAWYVQVDVAARFFVPFAPILYLYVADGGTHLVRGIAGWVQRRGWLGVPMLRGSYLLVCVSLLLGLATGKADAFRALGSDPFAQDRACNAEADALFAWFQANLPPDIDFLWGPSTTLGSWRYGAEYGFEEIPSDVDAWSDVAAYVSEEECSYAIIDIHTVHRRHELLSPCFTAGEGWVHVQAIPSDWALTYAQPGLPCRWCVFQLLDQQPISHPLSLTLGEQIRLLGYDVVHRRVHAGGRLKFTLYWQPLVPISEDYTVFTHLLGLENALLAQLDRQPLQGRVPTTYWLPGAIYADRFDMRLPPNIPPGEAQLEVGLYQLTTMERLPVVTSDGQRLPDDRVLLPSLIIIETAQS